MKLFASLTILCCSSFVAAQKVRLAGKVTHPTIDTISMVLLRGDTYPEKESHQIPVEKDRTFSVTLTLDNPVFGIIYAWDLQRRVLLTPGRDLTMTIGNYPFRNVDFRGEAAVENEFVQLSALSKPLRFVDNDTSALIDAKIHSNELSTFALKEWNIRVMAPLNESVQVYEKRIKALQIPDSLKALLSSEIRYAHQCYLDDFIRIDLRNARNKSADSLRSFVMKWQSLPDSTALRSGYYANMILDRVPEFAIGNMLKGSSANASPIETVADYLKTSASHIMELMQKHGKTTGLNWLYARLYLPIGVRDKVLFNKLLDAIDNNNVGTSQYVLDTMELHFPQSSYLAIARSEVEALRKKWVASQSNTKILFKDGGEIRSMAELLSPYRGKIVYLDIWGTWCGPCKEEMKYIPELKRRYSDSTVAFIYLDMDDAWRETAWKEYVQLNQMEGYHYRMDKTQIEFIWKAIEAAGANHHQYPTYVLADSNGKIIHANAKRPSDREVLYKQIDRLLDMPGATR